MAQPIWITPAGSLGTAPSQVSIEPKIQLSSESGVLDPLVTYKIISGSLPTGVTMSVSGLISGTPSITAEISEYVFVVRATNVENQIKDRTFYLTISGYAGPKFDISSGSLLSTVDSQWVEKYVPYTNSLINNPVTISVVQGALPPGLEINSDGLIRGYPNIPLEEIKFLRTLTTATSTTAVTNTITCSSTLDFAYGRPIVFTGVAFGGIIPEKTYYVKDIINSTEFTISLTQFGPEVYLNSGVGFMNVTLPAVTIGQPTIRTYTFDLLLRSPNGNDLKSYYITIINQNLSNSRGGPGNPYLTRQPTILNTRPLSFTIPTSDPYYAYYLFPEDNKNNTYSTDDFAFMGEYESDNYISFKIIGYTFDNFEIKYQFVGLPTGLTGDENTGWVYGNPILNSDTIGRYSFTVRAYKTTNPAIQSKLFNFSLNIYKTITSTVVWLTPTSLGNILNNTVCTKKIEATADVDLEYRVVSGNLPANLKLELNGEITGFVANQPTNQLLPVGTITTFTFGVQTYSPKFPLINSIKQFNLTVTQQYEVPTDTLYMRAAPSISDRLLIDSLLTNNTIIPDEYIYRLDDSNFGKAKAVIYEHQYGVNASDIEQYLANVQRSFYWRNITLGPLQTAIARDENNNIIYEVVYSKIIDDLVNPEGESISFDVVWPTPIPLGLGPWITSITNIYTSYETINDQPFTTSLTPGYAEVLYPNSLLNMNKQIANSEIPNETIGQQYDSKLLPQWMTSQQLDGNTLGFTRAWVICYTKPGYSKIIKNNIETLWVNRYGEINKLNQINFRLDRFSVDKSLTYNYNNYFDPPTWTGLPSATPVPDPKNSKDFYVLFPRKTILPDNTQL